MKKAICVLTMAVLFLTACDNDKKQAASSETHEDSESHSHADHDHGNSSEQEARSIEATALKNASTTLIIDGYLQIKNALVADDKDGASLGAKALLNAFAKFDMTEITESQHKEYMEILETAKEHAEHIARSPIDHQREHFEVLSTDINDLVALLGTDKSLYQDFCPMANGGKGAIWLSEIEEIKNPFYGSSMLTCGTVQKKIN